MKYLFLVTQVLLLQSLTYGQNKSNSLETLAKFDLGLQGIGLTYEPRLSNKMTSGFSFGFGGGYDISESYFEFQVFEPALYFSVTPKIFYNLNHRLGKGKSILNNSGDYIGVRLKYNMPLQKKTDIIRKSILTNIHWGLQRSIGNHWIFNSLIGVGYAHDIHYDVGTIYPALDFSFSYILK